MTIEERAREYIERSNIDEASGIITDLLEEVERLKRELSVLKDVEVCKECISDTTRAAYERCVEIIISQDSPLMHHAKPYADKVIAAIRKEMEKL